MAGQLSELRTLSRKDNIKLTSNLELILKNVDGANIYMYTLTIGLLIHGMKNL